MGSDVPRPYFPLPPLLNRRDTSRTYRAPVDFEHRPLQHTQHPLPLPVLRLYPRFRKLHFPRHNRLQIDRVRVPGQLLAPFVLPWRDLKLCVTAERIRRKGWVWRWGRGLVVHRHRSPPAQRRLEGGMRQCTHCDLVRRSHAYPVLLLGLTNHTCPKTSVHATQPDIHTARACHRELGCLGRIARTILASQRVQCCCTGPRCYPRRVDVMCPFRQRLVGR